MRLIDADVLKMSINFAASIAGGSLSEARIQGIIDEQKTVKEKFLDYYSTLKLEPCPHCGCDIGEAVINTPIFGHSDGVFTCCNCGIQMEIAGCDAKDVIEKWNALPRKAKE